MFGLFPQVCTEAYGFAPEVTLSGDLQALIPYLPAHLDYMLYELLKNSMRATVEKYRGATYRTRGRLPPIQARVCSGKTHLTVRISDQGGGIPHENLDRVWSYGFTTSSTGVPGIDINGQQQHVDEALYGSSSSGSTSESDMQAAGAEGHLQKTQAAFGALLADVNEAPRRRYSLAGLGFGLPLSRLHARYFGGDLKLVNLPGYGVDAFLTVRRLDTAGWHEQHDGDVAAAGQAAAVHAAVEVQQQLDLSRQSTPVL